MAPGQVVAVNLLTYFVRLNMMPFLKLPLNSYKRIWQSIRGSGLILNGSGKDYQMASDWLKLVTKHRHDHKQAVDRWRKA